MTTLCHCIQSYYTTFSLKIQVPRAKLLFARKRKGRNTGFGFEDTAEIKNALKADLFGNLPDGKTARKNDKKDMGILTGRGLSNVGLSIHLLGDMDSRILRISAVDKT